MVKTESLCCGCTAFGDCMGSACPNYEKTFYICDDCDKQEKLYYFDGYELCLDCILERLKYVEEEFATCEECNSNDDLYWFEGEMLCADCIEKRLERVVKE